MEKIFECPICLEYFDLCLKIPKQLSCKLIIKNSLTIKYSQTFMTLKIKAKDKD